MGKALYRKYRSKNLAEIVGQEHITTALKNALERGSISHAYLFTGPRGVGKTSIARILAHEVNGLPYDEDSHHLDIIEIDAASNRRIDEIRELRERVHTAPAAAKYKVYIIDEVHMLTKEAFNALLKTLEEPPAHAIFILATTEAHKLPDTIISRTQRFTFRPIESNQAIAHLREIADNEKIAVTDEALALIAEHGGGSFRDSISLLDQASTGTSEIGVTEVQSMLGVAPDESIESLLEVLETGTPAELVDKLQSLREHGYNPSKIAKQLSGRIRDKVLAGKLKLDDSVVTIILNDLLHVSASHDPETSFEIVLMSILLKHRAPTAQPVNISSRPIEPTEPALKPEPTKEQPRQHDRPIPAPSQPEPLPEPVDEIVHSVGSGPVEEPAPTPVAKKTSNHSDDQIWQQALEAIRKKHNTLYGIARMAKATVDNDEITLCFKFAFHQKRINEAKNKQILVDIIQEITGRPVTISCTVDKNLDAKPKAIKAKSDPKPTDPDAVDTISNIFGSAEVIE